MSSRMKFSDVHAAARLRDFVRDVARKEIDQVHPADIFGVVSDIDEIAGTVKYVASGAGAAESSASYGFGEPPAVGSSVRIVGRSGARYVVPPGSSTGLPPGGDINDVLTKHSGDDYDVFWSPGASATAASDTFWELEPATSTAIDFLRAKASLVDTGDDSIHGVYLGEFEYDTGSHIHKAYLKINPGTDGPGHSISNGQDIQASAWIDGTDNTMDWYFWSRVTAGKAEAGTFFDAIGDDLAGHASEAYMEAYATGIYADWFAFISTPGSGALIGLFPDDDDVCYLDFEDDGGNAYLRFRKIGGSGAAWKVAPDAKLGPNEWSIGTGGGGIDLIYKINDAGTIKTLNIGTPT